MFLRRAALTAVAATCVALISLGNAPAAEAGVSMSDLALSITKTHVGNFTVGTNGTFTLTVANGPTSTSATSAGSVTVRDTLPAGLSYVSAAGTDWTCVAGTPVVCTFAGSIAIGGSTSFTLTVAVAAAARPSVVNTATVVHGAFDPNAANDTSADTVTVDAAAAATPNSAANGAAITVPGTGAVATSGSTGVVVGTALALLAFGAGLVAVTGRRRRSPER